MGALKWIAGGLAIVGAVAGGVWFMGRRAALNAAEKGAETMPDGRIVAWTIEPAGSAWRVSIGIGRDPIRPTGTAPTKDLAHTLLESKLRDLRSGTPTIGASVNLGKIADALGGY